jgi:hypothetical protein
MRRVRLNCPFQQERLGGKGQGRGQVGKCCIQIEFYIQKDDGSINEDDSGDTKMPFSSNGFIRVGHGQGRATSKFSCKYAKVD